MKKTIRIAAATAAITASMGLAGLAVAAEAQAHPGPLPTWCPGEFWDPGWGDNWNWGGCHDNFRPGWGGPGGAGWDRDRGPGWDHRGPGGPGWDHRGPGW